MNSKRFYYLMLGCIGFLVLGLGGGAYAASKILQQESNQLLTNRLEAAVLSAEQTQLTQAKQDVQKYQDLATIAQSVVPQDKDQAQTVQQIADIANANGIQLSSITFPSSTLGQVTAGNKPQLSQLKPVKGISGVYNLDLVVQSAQARPIPYSQFISFLSDLEHNRRTALVNNVTILPNPKDRSTLSFTLDLNEYIKP
jgi:hypothetical protein